MLLLYFDGMPDSLRTGSEHFLLPFYHIYKSHSLREEFTPWVSC